MAALVAPVLSLPEYTATFPDKARTWKTDPKTVTIRSFTVGQDTDANAASQASGTRFEYELLQRCVVEVDGKPVDQDTPDFINSCSPKIRVLLVRLLNKYAMPNEEETKAFDESVEVRVP